MIKNKLRKILSKFGDILQSEKVIKELQLQTSALIDSNYHLLRQSNPRYTDEKRLLTYGYQVLAQTDEDGIIAEIFKRISTTNQFFVEFGVGNGIENNSANLLFQSWKGLWIEGNLECVTSIQQNLKRFITSNQLKIHQAFISENNVEQIFTNFQVPVELDLLSIDVDSFDYYIWHAINKFKPRIIVIEYNPSWGPTTEWIMPKDVIPSFTNHTSCYGASLKSYEKLGIQKGYSLVGCNITGANAFFVRNDLVKDLFASPFTSENHYEPPRYHLLRQIGHPRSFNIYQ